MKIMKRMMVILLTLCFISPCFSIVANAADGVLMFSDPETTAGKVVEVTVRMQTEGAPIGDGEVTVTYDTSMLEFVDGDNATGGDGTINLLASGTGSETELVYTLRLKTLQEGEAKLEVSDYKAFLYSDEKLDIASPGSSTITIGPSDGTEDTVEGGASGEVTDVRITVDGKDYMISEAFSDEDIPTGFTRTEMPYNGQTCQVLQQASSGQYLIYLEAVEEETSAFFLYNEDNDEFSPFEQVYVSENCYIMLLRDKSGVKLPKEYKETTITLNGHEFPTWQNTEEIEYYVVKALNSDGQENLYRYDTREGTYQRFVPPTEKEEESGRSGFIGGLIDKIEKYMDKVLIGAWILFVIMLIIIIVLAVKLHNRNAELDDIYDVHENGNVGIEEKTEPNETIAKRERTNRFRRDQDEEDDFEADDYEDASEDIYAEDEFEADYEDSEVDYYNDPEEYDDLDYEDDDEVESSYDDDDDDDFKIDFIDLDD